MELQSDNYCLLVDGYPLVEGLIIQDWMMEINPTLYVCFPRRYVQLKLHYNDYTISGEFPSCVTVEMVTQGFNNVKAFRMVDM